MCPLHTWRHPADVNGCVVDTVHCDSGWCGWSATKRGHLSGRFTGHQTKVILHCDAVQVGCEDGQSTMLKKRVCSNVDA